MQKLKLLFLGVFISILSIGSFSNAQFISSSDYDCNSLNGKLILVSSISSIVSSDPEGTFRVKYSTDPNCNNYYYCTWNNLGYFNSLSVSSLPSNAKFLYISSPGCGNSNGSFVYTILFKSDKMPISALTPVITGVKDTTFQLILLVVYIGISVLLVTLGFFAIRWLVNWMGGKINSYFSSKKR